jgi:hypothetical protein
MFRLLCRNQWSCKKITLGPIRVEDGAKTLRKVGAEASYIGTRTGRNSSGGGDAV